MRILNDLLRWPGKPVAYPGLLLTDLKRFVKGYLLQLGPGSVFLLERETKPGFLQLAIAERRDRWLKVEYGLPDNEWSRAQFDLVHESMVSAGYDTHVEVNDENMQIPRFLRVYVEGNRVFWSRSVIIRVFSVFIRGHCFTQESFSLLTSKLWQLSIRA